MRYLQTIQRKIQSTLTKFNYQNLQKAEKHVNDKINEDGKKIAEKMNVLNRMDINGTNDCIITLKDHKENFENNLPTRLINPAKNEVGRISKVIEQNLNDKLTVTEKYSSCH